MAPILGYWDVRGLGNPIRYLLAHAGVEYEDKHYTCGGPPDFDRSSWLKDKFTLGLAFPNLPYYIDGDVKLSQSAVILRYLARKHGLDGKTEIDRAHIELLAAQIHDYHMNYVRLVYNPDFKNLRADYTKAIPDNMKALSEFLGSKTFVAGDYVTYVDFLLFEYLQREENLTPGVYKAFKNLDQYHDRIASLPGIEKYFASPKAIKGPYNGAPALFGGKFSDQLCK